VHRAGLRMSARLVLRGGLRLESHKARPLEHSVQLLPAPSIAVLALDQGSGEEARAVVTPGTRVRVGTRVAAGIGAAADLHSPVSGEVRAVELRPTASGQGTCIVVASDGRDEREPGLAPLNWSTLDGAALLEALAGGGLAGFGGAAFPTAGKLALARVAGVELLLLNGAECEPWICCDDALLRERASDVVLGTRVMLAACGATRATIALEDDKPEARAALEAALAAAGDARLAIVVLPAVFPLGAEGLLIAAVTGREVPTGALPPEVGVVCQNVGTAAAVARYVSAGMPALTRLVTVTGSGVRRPANLEARIGTPVAELVAACGGYGDTPPAARLIAGGSLTGRALATDAVPVTKGLNCVLVATAADLPWREAQVPCIRCGDCAAVCPVALLPQQLHRAARADDLAGLARFGLTDCIECGCCDYVCPSAIPLTAGFRAARERQQLHEAERRRAVETKARYERHRRRQGEQAEAERRAFEAARRRAQSDGTGSA
jgi:Na+-translocating ferredoxin:NAD+ oxidoreductase subunit C